MRQRTKDLPIIQDNVTEIISVQRPFSRCKPFTAHWLLYVPPALTLICLHFPTSYVCVITMIVWLMTRNIELPKNKLFELHRSNVRGEIPGQFLGSSWYTGGQLYVIRFTAGKWPRHLLSTKLGDPQNQSWWFGDEKNILHMLVSNPWPSSP